jgi:hypothetical protein
MPLSKKLSVVSSLAAFFHIQTMLSVMHKLHFNRGQADTISRAFCHWPIPDAEIKRNVGSIRRLLIATHGPALRMLSHRYAVL